MYLSSSCNNNNNKRIPGKFWNVVLEKDGEDQLDRSYEKLRRVIRSQGGKECPIYTKKREC